MQEEIFGPIIPIYFYKSYDEVNEIVNLYKDPLVCYIFSQQKNILNDDIRSGSIVYNDTLIQMSSPLPFGGIGSSGIGSYHGKKSFEVFSYKQSILIRRNWGELILARFPPYNIFWKKIILKITQKVYSLKIINSIFEITMNCLKALMFIIITIYIYRIIFIKNQ